MISSIELKSNDIDDDNQEINSVNYLLIKNQFNSYSKQKRFCRKILWWKK
jgi:hypothetical protein